MIGVCVWCRINLTCFVRWALFRMYVCACVFSCQFRCLDVQVMWKYESSDPSYARQHYYCPVPEILSYEDGSLVELFLVLFLYIFGVFPARPHLVGLACGWKTGAFLQIHR